VARAGETTAFVGPSGCGEFKEQDIFWLIEYLAEIEIS